MRFKRVRSYLNATIVVACLFAMACQSRPVLAASSPAKIVIAHAGMNARTVVLWTAQEQKFFAKYGSDAQVIFIRQAPILLAGMSAGNVQIAATGGTSALLGASGGMDLKVVLSTNGRVTNDIVAAPNIKNLKELRGKRFALQGYGGTLWMAIMLGFEHLGVDHQAINFVVIGDQTVQAQALEAGRIDAAALDPVFSRRLKQKGFTVLAELYQANLPFIGSGIVVSDSFVREQSETLENILKSLVEAIAFVLGPKNRATVVNTIKTRLQIADPALAEEGYQDVLKSLEKNPTPSLEGMRNMHRLLRTRNPSVDKVKPEQLIDDRIMRKLDESGFISRLHAVYGVK
jgi:NitT/TauT family transport system substrate-binding protein